MQAQMDQAWAAWIKQAAREVGEATGADVESLGEEYKFQEFDPLKQAQSVGRKPTAAETLGVRQEARGGHRDAPAQ